MITFTKDKIIYSNHYRPEADEYVEEEVLTLLPHLNEAIKLSDDFTLGDFFRYVMKEKMGIEKVFTSHLGHFPLQPFIDEAFKKPENKRNDIDYLELGWVCELWDFSDYSTFDNYPYFHGWGRYEDPGKDSGSGEMVEGGLAVEFTPLNEMKHLVIKLNEEVEIYKYGKNKKTKIIFKGEHGQGFSVYDFIGEILSELSFAGTPSDRDEQWDQITSENESISKRYKEEQEQGIETDSEESHFISAEKLSEELDRRSKKKLKKMKPMECNHEWVNRIDGYEEQSGPAICKKCGKYGCWRDAKYSDMSDTEKEMFMIKGIPGNDHELEKKMGKKK